MNVVEITSPNLSSEMKPHRHEPRFVSWVPGGPFGDPTSYREAVCAAIDLGDDGCVGFVSDEQAPVAAAVKVDWSQPRPSIISRKRKAPLSEVR
jgi:hypothetical protein